MTIETLHPPGWAQGRGYAHGVSATGRLVATAGQIGWDPVSCEIVSEDFAAQAAQALRNIVAVLRTGGAGPEHLVRLTWYVTSREEYVAAGKAVGLAYREIIGRHFPAMAVIVVQSLLDRGAKVEIEATAVVPA